MRDRDLLEWGENEEVECGGGRPRKFGLWKRELGRVEREGMRVIKGEESGRAWAEVV